MANTKDRRQAITASPSSPAIPPLSSKKIKTRHASIAISAAKFSPAEQAPPPSHRFKVLLRPADNPSHQKPSFASHSHHKPLPSTNLSHQKPLPSAFKSANHGPLSSSCSSPPASRRFTSSAISTRESASKSSMATSAAADDDLDADDLGEKPFKKRKLEEVAIAAAAAAGFPHPPASPAPHMNKKKPTVGLVARQGLMSPQILSDKDKGNAESERSGQRSSNQLGETLSRRLLEGVLDRLQKKDTYGVFAEPVDPKEVPGYYDFIKNPMDFGTMRKKINDGAYSSLEMFQDDIYLICSNAMSYNAKDTIYFKQARSIQDAARKIMEALKAGLPFEGDLKSQQSPVKKLSYRRPPAWKSRFEAAGSDYTSGASLATCDYGAWIEMPKGLKAGQLDRHGVITAASSLEGQALTGWGTARIGNSVASSPGDSRLEFQDNLSVFKPMTVRDGKRMQLYEDNRRNTYLPPESLVCGIGPILMALGGEVQQLMPMGQQQQDFAYARSLARFSADLGPAIWKVAAEKIHKALPPGVPFGPGWVLEPPPGVLPLTKGQSTSVLPNESKVLAKSVPGFHGNNAIQQGPKEVVCSTSTSSISSSSAVECSSAGEKIPHIYQFASKSLPPDQLHTQAALKLGLTGTNLTAEVSQSKLLELVSQNGRLFSWASSKQMEQAATLQHAQGSGGSHHFLGEKGLKGSANRSVNFDSGASLVTSGREMSSRESQHGWATHLSSTTPSLLGNEKQQLNPVSAPGLPPPSQTKVSGNAITIPMAQHQDVEAATQQCEFQSRLAAAQQENKRIATTVSQFMQHQLSHDVPSCVQLNLVQMHQQASVKQGPKLGAVGPCDLHESNLVNPHDLQGTNHETSQSYLSVSNIAGSTASKNEPWGSVSRPYPLQEASKLSHSLPPDLNVSLLTPKSALAQPASGNLTDAQQPDLALQL